MGSAMIAVAILAVFIAGLIATYLTMISHEYAMVARSQTWNAAMPVAEAGIEEGLQAINQQATNFSKITIWTNSVLGSTNGGWDTSTSYRNLTWTINGVTNKWQATNGMIFHLRRSLDATSRAYFDVYVNNTLNATNTGPEILSIGYAQSDTRTAVRKVYLKTRRKSINGNLSAKSSITLSGNNITADSFDSSDQYHSDFQSIFTFRGAPYGFYPASPSNLTSVLAPDYSTEPYKRKDNAYVASNGSISAGNANVCGYVDTGPGQSSPSMGPQGVAGDVKTWIGPDPVNPWNNGIQSGHWLSDMNFNFADVPLPSVSWTAVTHLSGNGNGANNNVDFTNYNGGTYTFRYVINNMYPSFSQYTAGVTNFTISGSVSDPVLVRGTNISLYLPSGLNFNGTGNTILVDTNSDLTIYAGANIDMTGNGNIGINNIARYAPAFKIYGLPSCTLIKLAGQPTITAYIYAPEAELDLVGGGSGYYDAVGAFYCNVVKMTGNMNFHYDEALDTVNPATAYLPSNWQEVQ